MKNFNEYTEIMNQVESMNELQLDMLLTNLKYEQVQDGIQERVDRTHAQSAIEKYFGEEKKINCTATVTDSVLALHVKTGEAEREVRIDFRYGHHEEDRNELTKMSMSMSSTSIDSTDSFEYIVGSKMYYLLVSHVTDMLTLGEGHPVVREMKQFHEAHGWNWVSYLIDKIESVLRERDRKDMIRQAELKLQAGQMYAKVKEGKLESFNGADRGSRHRGGTLLLHIDKITKNSCYISDFNIYQNDDETIKTYQTSRSKRIPIAEAAGKIASNYLKDVTDAIFEAVKDPKFNWITSYKVK